MAPSPTYASAAMPRHGWSWRRATVAVSGRNFAAGYGSTGTAARRGSSPPSSRKLRPRNSVTRTDRRASELVTPRPQRPAGPARGAPAGGPAAPRPATRVRPAAARARRRPRGVAAGAPDRRDPVERGRDLGAVAAVAGAHRDGRVA